MGFIFGCNQNKEPLELAKTTLLPIKKIAQINDSTFLSIVLNIVEDEGLLYFSDFKNKRIVCVDLTYKLTHIFGSPGKGPSEFNFPGGCLVNNNRLYAIDEGNRRINIYDLTGGYIGQIKGVIPHNGRFIINDSAYFGSLRDTSKGPIFKADLNGDLIKRFGTQERVLNNVNQNMPRTFFLEMWQDQILAIGKNDPIIERYSINGELIDRFDYLNLKHFDTLIPYLENEQKKSFMETGMGGDISFFVNSYLYDNRLFILLSGWDKSKNNATCNQILVLDVGKEKITPIKILKLENDNGNEPWYFSFCVTDNRLIAYDNFSYEIHEFRFNL